MNILDPALRTALRTLKLTGMLDTLDARLAQRHPQRIAVLLTPEARQHGQDKRSAPQLQPQTLEQQFLVPNHARTP